MSDYEQTVHPDPQTLPDMAEDVNDHILDDLAVRWMDLVGWYEQMKDVGAWYSLAKAENPTIASAMIKAYMAVDKAINLEGK